MKAIVDEPPIDTSVDHYMEGSALAIALAMARTPEEQDKVEHLVALRTALMEHRRVHLAAAKGHARVAAINATALSRQEMDARVKGLYMQQGTLEDVLRVHARTHFADGLVSQRLGLVWVPADVADSARKLQAHEETFARAWIDAVGDPAFVEQMRVAQREAVTDAPTTTTSDPASSSPPPTDGQNR